VLRPRVEDVVDLDVVVEEAVDVVAVADVAEKTKTKNGSQLPSLAVS
jgi:hypothetical protein